MRGQHTYQVMMIRNEHVDRTGLHPRTKDKLQSEINEYNSTNYPLPAEQRGNIHSQKDVNSYFPKVRILCKPEN